MYFQFESLLAVFLNQFDYYSRNKNLTLYIIALNIIKNININDLNINKIN